MVYVGASLRRPVTATTENYLHECFCVQWFQATHLLYKKQRLYLLALPYSGRRGYRPPLYSFSEAHCIFRRHIAAHWFYNTNARTHSQVIQKNTKADSLHL